MGKLLNQLQTGKIFVSDGAWGTFLHQKGLQPGQCPEEWNISHRQIVFDIASSYIHAGADVIETNSFGGSRLKLDHFGFGDRVTELNQAAAEISREAAGNNLVLGSIGPSGKMVMMGEVTEDDLYEIFKEQAVALEKGGADAICIETMTALDEASAAVRASKENTSLDVICTMTFDKTVTGDYRTMMGVSPVDVIQPLIDAGADILGSNCGNGMANMVEIISIIRAENSNIPLLVQANAGAPIVQDGKTVFPETPEQMAEIAPKLVEAGANIIGGCCGTTPDHIKAIRDAIQ